MRDMHDGSFSPDCVDCLKYEKSQLEAELREQKALTEEVHTKLDALSGQLDAALTDRTVERDRVASLHRANSDLRAENARRRNENKGLQAQLDEKEGEKTRLRSTLNLTQDAARDRISFLEEGNERMRAVLDDAREEIQQRNEEIAELKRARLYGIPTTYIVGADPSDPVWSRMKLLEEENARLEADNAKLEARNEQTSISLEHVRQDLFNAQAKLTAVRNAVK